MSFPLPEPDGSVPRRRLRAITGFVGALLAFALVPWLDGVDIAALALLAVLGASATWQADARSPLDAWQRSFPGVSLRGIHTLPRGEEAVRTLAQVCLEVSHGLREERELRAGWRGWWRGRRVRQQLQALPRHAAALAVRLERLAPIEDPRLDRRRQQLRLQLAQVLPLAARLRTSAARSIPDPWSQVALRTLGAEEQQWSAELDSADELGELEWAGGTL